MCHTLSILLRAVNIKDEPRWGCVSFFCAVCLLEQTRGKGLPPPAILSLGTPSLLACGLGCRRNRHGRWLHLLTCSLPFTKTLLLTSLTLEMALVPTQAMLLLPGLCPTLIEQCQPQGQHGIDMLRFPMHARSFEASLYQ